MQLIQLLSDGSPWGAAAPDRLLYLDSDFTHPKTFVTPALSALGQFKKQKMDAKSQVDLGLKAAKTSAAKDAAAAGKKGGAAAGGKKGGKPAASPEQMVLEIVNSVLFAKLVTSFTALVEAAAAANHWIVVDRVHALSPAAELLLECALEQSPTTPTVLVLDSYKRLRHFGGFADEVEAAAPRTDADEASDGAARCLRDLRLVREAAVALPNEEEPSSAPVPTLPVPLTLPKFYNCERFVDPFATHCLAPPACAPEPAHETVEKKKR